MVGAVAQLGERRVRNAEVRGSIPLGSTNAPPKRLYAGDTFQIWAVIFSAYLSGRGADG